MPVTAEILRRIDEADLLARLLALTLLKSAVRPYARADLRVAAVEPDLLFPASHYVARSHLEKQRVIRDALLPLGVDTLALVGGVEFRLSDAPDAVWTIIPPVVEFQVEQVSLHPGRPGDLAHPARAMEFPLVNDGLHRVWLARELGLPVRVVLVRGADPAHPYYAYPAGWSAVSLVDEVPADKSLRKRHRTENHYALYRDFGPLGVGKPRHPSEIR